MSERPGEGEEIAQVQVHRRAKFEQSSLELDSEKENGSHQQAAVGGSSKHLLHQVDFATVKSERHGNSSEWKVPKPTWKDEPIPGSQNWKKKGFFSAGDHASICFANNAYPCDEGAKACCCNIGCEHSGTDASRQEPCVCRGGPSYTKTTSSSGGGLNEDVQKYMIPRSKESHFCRKQAGIKSHSHECGEKKRPGCCCNGGYDFNLDRYQCLPSEDRESEKPEDDDRGKPPPSNDTSSPAEQKSSGASSPDEVPKSGAFSPFWRVSCKAAGAGIFALLVS